MEDTAPAALGSPNNSTMSVVMTTPGTDESFCVLHPQMKATATVMAANAVAEAGACGRV